MRTSCSSWLFLIVLAVNWGCVSWSEHVEPRPAPQTLAGSQLEAPKGPLQDAARAAAEGRQGDVQGILQNFQPQDDDQLIWTRYLIGEAQMNLGSYERGWKNLMANYEALRDQAAQLSPASRRVAAKSLQKIAWWHRQRQQWTDAYFFHHMQYLYLRAYGSLEEQHEALISLDQTSYRLRNHFASEVWLRESIQLGMSMPEGLARQRALGTSWNHLAATLREQSRWQEAINANLESRKFWLALDQATGRAEEQELWGLAQAAEILSAWGQFLQSQDPAAARQKWDEARTIARQALMRGEQSRLDAAARGVLETRLRPICPRPCL